MQNDPFRLRPPPPNLGPVPSYDWLSELGEMPPLTMGQTYATHPLNRALSHETTQARARRVFKKVIEACEGRAQLIAQALACHPVMASRMLTREDLAGLAAELRAKHGHAGESGYGAPPGIDPHTGKPALVKAKPRPRAVVKATPKAKPKAKKAAKGKAKAAKRPRRKAA